MSARKLTPETMMAKAEDACSAARLLLEEGYPDDATSRAYYAMFDAARAALLLSNAPVDLSKVRTHNGLIGAFGNYLVKNGTVPKDIGHFLNQTKDFRLVADYDGNRIEFEDAEVIVEKAETFVAAIRAQFIIYAKQML
jgi:uncharacterized protein (UPF0332 family)